MDEFLFLQVFVFGVFVMFLVGLPLHCVVTYVLRVAVVPSRESLLVYLEVFESSSLVSGF
jgi:hypothetical protein